MPPETTPAGATPAATGATPVQSEPGTPASGEPTAAPVDAATGDESALGDAGKRAIQVEREAARTAKAEAAALAKELEALKLASASESEKAIAAAKAEGKSEVLTRLHATVRRATVREALIGNGALPSLVADLSRADEFASLTVNDDDEIDPKELADAVKAHKARVPDAYTKPATPPGERGSADGGAAGGRAPAKDLESALEQHFGQPAPRI